MIDKYLNFDLNYDFNKIIEIDKKILNTISTYIENNIIYDDRISGFAFRSKEEIKRDTMLKLKNLLKIKSETPKEIIIIVPGDSGFRQVKAIELYLIKTKQDTNIKFVYIPLSGIKNTEPTHELFEYLSSFINGNNENYFIIYDYWHAGNTIKLIKNILNKLYDSPTIDVQQILDFKLLVEAKYRCQSKKYFAPDYRVYENRTVSKWEYNHCTCVIAWLFNTLL